MSRRLSSIAARTVLLLAVGVPLVAGADENKVLFPGGAGHAASPEAGGGTANLVTVLAAVALAAVGGWFMWRNRRGSGQRRESRALAIAETRSLGNRQYLVVASYEGKKFLLGVCPGRIDLLSSLGESRMGDERP